MLLARHWDLKEEKKERKDEFKELKMKTELNRQASASNAGSGDDERKKLHFISSFSAVAFLLCLCRMEECFGLEQQKKRKIIMMESN